MVRILTASRFYGEAKRARKLSPFIVEALGEEYVKKIEGSLKAEQATQQLSLLDIFNDTAPSVKKEVPTKKKEGSLSLSYISYSQIQTFQMCPLHYKLRYILNVPTHASPALSYGVSVHNTLREFFQYRLQKQEISADNMPELLKKHWLRDGYASRSHEEKAYTQAKEMLTRFAKNSLDQPMTTVALEHPFNFWLGKVKIGGRIDRIDKLPDGRLEIIDYKTGTNMLDEKKIIRGKKLDHTNIAKVIEMLEEKQKNNKG